MKRSDVEGLLRAELARILGEAAEIDTSHSLSELGLDSVGYVRVSAFLAKELGVALRPETLFELPSIDDTISHVMGLRAGAGPAAPGEPAVPGPPDADAAQAAGDSTKLEDLVDNADIAIVGIAVNLPGAADLDGYWRLIRGGDCVLRDFPAERDPGPVGAPPGYLKGGFLADVAGFDAGFFGISPREAIAMDPQQRLFLQCVWHAIEDAGYSKARLSGSNTAVFVGASSFDYFELLLRTQAARTTHIGTGLSHAILANRVSQFFNLKGASEAIDTACSSGLVALWRAVENLRRGQSDLALVGGVNLLAARTGFQIFADAGMLSPTGACLPFDDRAAGYVRGEGVVCLVVKRAADARRDGDHVWVTIKGGAVRHSGHTNSLTAPNPDAQADVIVAALADAAVPPASIGYIEAHGTGTSLGDPIEAAGLTRAFDRLGTRPGFALGSVKAQIGHLEAAAGLAGLVKAALALHHRWLPGSPYLREVNRHLDLDAAGFRLPVAGAPWSDAGPLRAGVSSFGFGGVNAHMVLEATAPDVGQAPKAARATATGPRLFVLSAKTAAALEALAAALATLVAEETYDDEGAEQNYLADLALGLARGRTPLPHRLAVLAGTAEELAGKLRQPRSAAGGAGAGVFAGVGKRGAPDVVDLFDDQAALDERIAVLVRRGEWHKVASLWVGGLDVDWDKLLPHGSGARVTLPLYPFARDRFWPRFAAAADAAAGTVADAAAETAAGAAADAATGPAAGSTAGPRTGFYVSRWVERALGADAGKAAGRGGGSTANDTARTTPPEARETIAVLVAGARGRLVAEVLRALRPVEIWAVPEANPTAGEAVTVAGLVDLTALDGGDGAHDSAEACARLEHVRVLLGGALKRGRRVEVLQATCGLAAVDGAPSTLAGAQEAGLYASLWAEYRHCRSKTVDFAPDGFEATAVAAITLAELGADDGAAEVAYRDGRRRVRVIEPVAGTAHAPDDGAIGGVLITGGTGAIAQWLVRDRVARGARAFLLTGRRELSAEQEQHFAALRHQGVSLHYFQGDICDAEAFGAALAAFRAAHGPLTHVYHCAGAVNRSEPAFFQKTASTMREVLRPKVDALWVLHALLAPAPPREVVLFSSISAVAPKLAAGVLDYAAANRYLDHFAAYQRGQGQPQYRSVQWTRWRETGLARDARSGADGAALAPEDCLAALERSRGLGATVCVAAEGDPALAPAARERGASPNGVAATPASRVAAPTRAIAPGTSAPAADFQAVRREIRVMVARELEMAEAKLDDEASFEALGIDSIVLMGLTAGLEAWLGRKIDPSELIACDSIARVAAFVVANAPASSVAPAAPAAPAAATLAPSMASSRPNPAGAPEVSPRFAVAVIGVACRFPGAPDRTAFWRNLAAGVDSVTPVPASRWDAEVLYADRPAVGKTISRWGGFIEGMELIEPGLFGMSAEDAADVDPLVRLFTECSLEALDDTTYPRAAVRGRRIGVFAGARGTRYAERIVTARKHSVTGIGQNFIAAYVSHLLDLRGPSLVIDCACSSSLAAVHLACQSLRSGDAELAIAGGVDLLLDEKPYLYLSAAHALSPDGRCRTFDEKANGFVPGEGVGCVVLKPLARALADGDPVYAVIDGSAMNNDGHTLGITTPGVEGQVDVIERALANAAVSPNQISYVETHGTGTMIGDPIELRALGRAFAGARPARCAVGSVKTNVGHLLSAAGIASFIKVALALHHETLPPTLHCDQVNPRLELERSPFYPVRAAEPWPRNGTPRRAGVSAFGFGKTNVHTILSERPAEAHAPSEMRTPAPRADKVYAWHAAPARPAPAAPHPARPAALLPPPGGSLLALEELSFDDA